MHPRLILIASAAALVATPAAAQPGEPWTAEGELEDGDGRDAEQHLYDDHRVTLEAGRRYRIASHSDAFDTVLQLRRPGEDEPVAVNDDFGGSLNSQVSHSPRESGAYVVRILGFDAAARGAYALRIETLAPLPPPLAEPTATVPASGSWLLWEGALAAGDPDRDGRLYDDHLIRVAPGETRYISLQSDAFDTLVEILPADDPEGDPVDQDDDAGPGFNSLLGFAPDEPGDYIVRVTSFSEGATGAYRLWVSQ